MTAPNLRPGKCCYYCKHVINDYEGECNCKLHKSKWGGWCGDVCDDFVEEE